MKVLNVAEKPAMARQITSQLSSQSFSTLDGKNKYCKNFEFPYTLQGRTVSMVMTSVLGHVKELDFPSEYSNWALTPPESLFDAVVTSNVTNDKKSIVHNLELESRSAQMLVIWTDCDREGEHIGSEIVQICLNANPRLDCYRARYSSVTREELRRACANLQRLDLRQVAAVETRCELDLRTGAIFTRFQTLRLQECFRGLFVNKEVISYGPCQFPTLGFVVEQYWKVLRFRAEAFWQLELEVAKDGVATKFNWKRGHLFDRLITLILYERCMRNPTVVVTEVVEKPTSRYRPLPLRTVEFQKAASKFLRISSDQVMDIAERLYNQGLISYPRTETDVFEFGPEQLRDLVQRQSGDAAFGGYASSLLSGGGFRVPRRGHNNDKAHPPIHPTGAGAELNGPERAVFEFVARRFLACCSDDARGMETIVRVTVDEERFEARGVKVTELNYLLVYKYDKWQDNAIAPFATGDRLVAQSLLMREGSTSCPPLLSEADLITCMDKNGIGTDATIHEHIRKILHRKYAVKRRDGRFVPTRLGVALVEAFDRLGLHLSLTQPKIRAQLERDLTLICEGAKTKELVLRGSIDMFREVYARVVSEFGSMLQVFRRYLCGEERGGGGSGGGAGGGPGAGSGPGAGFGPTSGPPPGPASGHGFDGGPFDQMPVPGSAPTRAPKRANTNAPAFSTDEHAVDDDENDDGDNLNSGRSRGKKTRGRGGAATRGGGTRAPGRATTVAPMARSTAGSTDETPKCNCGEDAVTRTVNKEGPNKGREFYSCPKGMGSNCDFFQWGDEATGGGGGYARGTAHSARTVSSGNTWAVVPPQPRMGGVSYVAGSSSSEYSEQRCKCGLIMTPNVAKTGANAGRAYATCSRIVQRCNTFVFLDGQPGNGNQGGNQHGSQHGGQSAEWAPKKGQTCFKCNKTGHWANACPN